jgi:hypothetical protein
MTKATTTECVVSYRTGGELSCKWHRLPGRMSFEAALAKRDELVRMGYAALVTPAHAADSLGLPIGWRAADVDWERDEIVYGTHETQWTSHKLLSAR